MRALSVEDNAPNMVRDGRAETSSHSMNDDGSNEKIEKDEKKGTNELQVQKKQLTGISPACPIYHSSGRSHRRDSPQGPGSHCEVSFSTRRKFLGNAKIIYEYARLKSQRTARYSLDSVSSSTVIN